MSSVKRSQRKRVAPTTGTGAAKRRSCIGAGPVQTTPPTLAQWNIPDEVIETIVKQITEKVTKSLTQSTQPSLASSGSAILQEDPIVVTTPSVPRPQPDTLFADAVITASL